MARIGGEPPVSEGRMTIPPLKATFWSAGFIHYREEDVAAIDEEDQGADKEGLVQEGAPGRALNNWTVQDLPVM